jgi:protein-S-isoprenylcysteine O-methyltransferase Ste14
MKRSAPALAPLTLRAHGYAVLVVGVFLLALPLAAASLDRLAGRQLPAALAVVGGVLLPLAGALSYASFWLFIARGRGTAFPTDPPRALVVLGAYRYVRNPMYLGNLGIALAEALLLRSPGALLYAVLLAAATHLYVTRVEEPTLEARYGEAYHRYRHAVPRWIPSRRPHPAGLTLVASSAAPGQEHAGDAPAS